jgi:hypothetical protein
MNTDKFNIADLYPKLYTAKQKKPEIVTVPALRVLAINGEGALSGPRFQDSVSALYTVAYSIKFMPRRDIVIDGYTDFKVPALEVLWRMRNGGVFDATKKDQWLWEVFIVVPGFVTQAIVKQAIELIKVKKPNNRYDDLHISSLQEKKAAQVLHVGSHEKVADDIELLQAYIKRIGYKPSARYHEIYLSDPLRTAKNKLKTILRQPIVPAN